MKERLDAIWNNHGCLLPNHFIRLGGDSGYQIEGLYYKKGKRAYSKRPKYVGKARWLCRNYGVVSRFYASNKIINQNIVGIN